MSVVISVEEGVNRNAFIITDLTCTERACDNVVTLYD